MKTAEDQMSAAADELALASQGQPYAAALAEHPSRDWRLWAWLTLIDVAVGVSWALMLIGAVLFITGISQFIYVDF